MVERISYGKRPQTLPVVLSQQEVVKLFRCISHYLYRVMLMTAYAAGLRVSEVVQLTIDDIDSSRGLIRVRQAKGRRDRYVPLSELLLEVLRGYWKAARPEHYLFPSQQRRDRDLSPRTVGRVIQRTLKIAGIGKHATPHSLRHSFASHSLTNGMDIRFIQKLLGHQHLETTTIYTKVSVPNGKNVQSPLDVLTGKDKASGANGTVGTLAARPVGRLQIHMRLAPDSTADQPKAQVTLGVPTSTRPIYFTGIVVRQQRPGWHTLDVPALDAWEEPLKWLKPPQRERFETAEFYRMLESQISRRFAALLQHRK